MTNIVVSTIGTSLLTNQINRSEPAEKHWYPKLRDSANLSWEDTEEITQTIINTLRDRALESLRELSVAEIRRTSAELNGLYGLYGEDLNQGRLDTHYLLATDTAQGRITADIVAEFLRVKGLNQAIVYVPTNLSTASTTAFTEGIDELLDWLETTIKPKRNSCDICFNLVGGFKSLQGYLNTLGMFYADKIIYIFEGKEANLITIPRLPVRVDDALLAPYRVPLALMDAGLGLSASEVEGIPEAMLGEMDGKKVLSTWGQLIWSQARDSLLTQELLPFPHLIYKDDTFPKDYKNQKDSNEKLVLQSVLAKLSAALIPTQGAPLNLPSSFKYSPYQGSDGIYHFYVNKKEWRVSCRPVTGGLELRYYGTHDYVQRKEGV
ncbi:MAG: putative CRISPR-associated protein [Cyanobacteria bacterium P01_H01_bin.21]